MLVPLAVYNPPFLQTVMLSPGEQGLILTDASVSAEPRQLGAVAALRNAWVAVVEEFPIDRMLDESDRPLKDVSHAGSRWLNLREIERLMLVPGEVLGTILEGDVPTQIPGATARLSFARLDLDHSGLLERDEVDGPLARMDRDGDGRVTLSELEGLARLVADDLTTSDREIESPFLRTRVDLDGDLARLLDGLNPFEFDRNGDRRLDRDETERAFVAALDLDGDGGLSLDELSRSPGELRRLRFGGLPARKQFEALDRNRNGLVSEREYRLRDEDLKALDVDRDGYVHLGEPPNPWWERRGFLPAQAEWPRRQAYRLALPPVLDLERFEALLDADGDGVLTRRELKGREDLFLELDRDGDGRVVRTEYERFVGLVERQGVEVTLDSFSDRWDLDGDGEVERGELAESAWRVVAERRTD